MAALVSFFITTMFAAVLVFRGKRRYWHLTRSEGPRTFVLDFLALMRLVIPSALVLGVVVWVGALAVIFGIGRLLPKDASVCSTPNSCGGISRPSTTLTPYIPSTSLVKYPLPSCEVTEWTAAEIQYDSSRTIGLGETATIEVVIALPGQSKPRPSSLPNSQKTIVACEVSGTLRGLDFEITPSDPKRLSFIATRTLTFSWQVKPKEPGLHNLEALFGNVNDGKTGTEQLVLINVGVTETAQQRFERQAKSSFGVIIDRVVSFVIGLLVALLLKRRDAAKTKSKQPTRTPIRGRKAPLPKSQP
jgi:hypothetical protein